MAYREVAMWKLLAVLERMGCGETQVAVAGKTGHGRNTIRGYKQNGLAASPRAVALGHLR